MKPRSGRYARPCSMRYRFLFLTLVAVSSELFATELTKPQCEAIGGTHTKVGCLVLDDSEKTKLTSDNAYMPGKDECNSQGGTWHEQHGCLAKITEQQCHDLGGSMNTELGCVQKLTRENCKELGGTVDENGHCAL